MTQRLVIIAGNGNFPIQVARKAKEQGYEVYAACIENEADPAIEGEVVAVTWLKLGQLKVLLNAIQRYKATSAVFIGGISRLKLFRNALPDLSMLLLLLKTGLSRDDAILRALAGEVEKLGVAVLGGSYFLPDSVVHNGLLTKRALTRNEIRDALVGWDAAKELGRLDAGQTAIVSNGSVVILEDGAGTDRAIERARSIGKGAPLTIIKTSKPGQDLRLDLPSVGERTLQMMKASNATALILEAQKAMIHDKLNFIVQADELGIALYAAHDRKDLERL